MDPRVLGCCVGRGMLTMHSMTPVIAEALPVPPLSLAARVPPTNFALTLDASFVPAELTLCKFSACRRTRASALTQI